MDCFPRTCRARAECSWFLRTVLQHLEARVLRNQANASCRAASEHDLHWTCHKVVTLTARAQHVVVQAAGPRMQHVVTAARATNKHSKHRNQTQMPAHQHTSDTDTCDTFRVASSMSRQWWWQSWEESDEHTTDWSSARASTEDAGRSSQRQRTLAAAPERLRQPAQKADSQCR